MTAIVGVLCQDGVVIASDSASTFASGSGYTIEQRAKKVRVIEDRLIVAGTGSVGLDQRFCHIVKGLHDAKNFNDTADPIVLGKQMSQMGVQDFQSTQAFKPPNGYGYGCLLAFPIGKKFHLLELEWGTFQPEYKTADMPFVTLGGGQAITDPFVGFLRKIFFAKGPPNLQDGKFIAVWALTHVIELNPGGIKEPVQVAVLREVDGKLKASLLSEGQLEEQAVSVAAAEEHLRKFQITLAGANPVKIPEAPTAPVNA